MENIEDEEKNEKIELTQNERKALLKAVRMDHGRPRKADHELSQPRRQRRIPDNAFEFKLKEKEIPARFRNIMAELMTLKHRPHASVLTIQDLDKIPVVCDLPTPEKQLLLRYWPHYYQDWEQVQAISLLRKEEADIVTNSHAVAKTFKEKFDLDNLSLGEQLKQTAHIYDRQIQHAALVLASTSIESLHSDPLNLNLYRLRVNYIKDFAWVRDKIHDLGCRLEKDIVGFVEDAKEYDEGERLLEAANKRLRERGYQLDDDE